MPFFEVIRWSPGKVVEVDGQTHLYRSGRVLRVYEARDLAGASRAAVQEFGPDHGCEIEELDPAAWDRTFPSELLRLVVDDKPPDPELERDTPAPFRWGRL